MNTGRSRSYCGPGYARFFSTLIALVFVGLPAFAVAEESILIADAWAPATPPNAPTAAVYLEVNNSGSDDEILAGHSDVAASLELHTHVHADGMMRMRQLESVDVAAGRTVKFEPHGLHVMLIDLKHDLRAGELIHVVLVFRDAGEIAFDAIVRDLRP